MNIDDECERVLVIALKRVDVVLHLCGDTSNF